MEESGALSGVVDLESSSTLLSGDTTALSAKMRLVVSAEKEITYTIRL